MGDGATRDEAPGVGEQDELEQHGGWIGRCTGIIVTVAGIEMRQVNLVIEEMIHDVSKVPGTKWHNGANAVSSFAATVEVTVDTAQAAAFEHIVPIDLTTIFTGFGPSPAVTGTHNQVGAWDAAGQTRTVYLSDGSSANERLNKYQHPNYFSYTVSGFTGALRFLTISADGEWWFSSNLPGKTNIRWRYTFNSKSFLTAPVLWFIANFLWRGYMRKALKLSAAQVERLNDRVRSNQPNEPTR